MWELGYTISGIMVVLLLYVSFSANIKSIAFRKWLRENYEDDIRVLILAFMFIPFLNVVVIVISCIGYAVYELYKKSMWSKEIK